MANSALTVVIVTDYCWLTVGVDTTTFTYPLVHMDPAALFSQ